MTNLALIRITLAAMWFYQGLVPKLLGPHADELAMDMAIGFSVDQAVIIAYIAGVVEILLGIAVLVFWRSRWPLQLTFWSMLGLLAYVIVATPVYLSGAFNPVIMNVSVAVLAWIALRLSQVSQHDD